MERSKSKSEATSTRTRSVGRRNEQETTAGGEKSTAEETKSKTASKDERGKPHADKHQPTGEFQNRSSRMRAVKTTENLPTNSGRALKFPGRSPTRKTLSENAGRLKPGLATKGRCWKKNKQRSI